MSQKNIFRIHDGRNRFWQWDKGQKIIIQRTGITELHFSNETMSEAIRSDVYKQGELHLADIPDSILEVAKDLLVYACIVGEDFSKTVYCARFSVVAKPKPSDWFDDSEMLPSDWFATIKYVDEKINDIQISGGGVSKEEVQAMIDKIELTPGPEGRPGQDGQNGTSVTITSMASSDEDGGSNIITFSDGNTVVVKNGSRGKQGDVGEQGVSIAKVEIINNELVVTLSNTDVLNLGNVKGEQGQQGIQGKDGVGIDKIAIDENGCLKVVLTTGVTIDLGNIKGVDGEDGVDGQTPCIKDGNWWIDDADTKVKAEGVDGKDGVGIDEVYIQDGNLYVKKTTDSAAINLGRVKGDNSAVDQTYVYDSENAQSGLAVTEALKTTLKIDSNMLYFTSKNEFINHPFDVGVLYNVEVPVGFDVISGDSFYCIKQKDDKIRLFSKTNSRKYVYEPFSGQRIVLCNSIFESDSEFFEDDVVDNALNKIGDALKQHENKFTNIEINFGNIDTALDNIISTQESIIAIQNSLIGGESV